MRTHKITVEVEVDVCFAAIEREPQTHDTPGIPARIEFIGITQTPRSCYDRIWKFIELDWEGISEDIAKDLAAAEEADWEAKADLRRDP